MIQMPPNNNHFLNANETCMLNTNPEAFIQTTTSSSTSNSTSTSTSTSSSTITSSTNISNTNNSATNAYFTPNTSLSYYTEEITNHNNADHSQITNSLNFNFFNEESTRDLNTYLRLEEPKSILSNSEVNSINSSSSSSVDEVEFVLPPMDEEFMTETLLIDFDAIHSAGNFTVSNQNQTWQKSDQNIVQHNNDSTATLSLTNPQQNVAHYSNPPVNPGTSVNTPLYIKLEYTQDEATNSSYSGSDPAPVKAEIVQINQKNGKTVVEKHYGPIVVRPRKKPAPTLASGRKSKYIALPADESLKRETRRERNRQAAEKCKQKRTEIESKLENDLIRLENEKNTLDKHLKSLQEAKCELQQLFESHAYKCTNRMPNGATQLQPTHSNLTNTPFSFSTPYHATYQSNATTAYVSSSQAQTSYYNYSQSNLQLPVNIQQPAQSTRSTMFIPQQQPNQQFDQQWTN